MNSDSTPAATPPAPGGHAPRRFLRRLLRGLAWLALVLLVLAAPTLAYHARWSWPRANLPEVGTAQEQQRAAPAMDPALATRLMAIVREARSTSGLPSLSAPLLAVDSLLGPAPVGVCLTSAEGTDIALVRAARRLERTLA